MRYPDAIDYLYGLQKHGIKLGLEKIQTIEAHLGNPHRNFLSVHVAGTNGKGSVSAMIASILTAHGLKVGLFTSPHLVSFTERISISGERITESEVVALTREVQETLAAITPPIAPPTFFEVVTAIAFLHFSRKKVDWAVVEVGMGGRMDSTNVIIPEVSVITPISLDHRQFLGETLSDIAREKAGIIKEKVPVISAAQAADAEAVIRRTVRDKKSCLFTYGKDFRGTLKSSGLGGITFTYSDGVRTMENLFTPLAGEHQLSNACCAIKAAVVALENPHCQATSPGIPEENSSISLTGASREGNLREGLAAVQWHGRLEVVSNDPLIMIDGAHNPAAAEALAAFIGRHLAEYRIILIAGVMSDKDIAGILAPLLPLASDIIFTAPDYGRAASPHDLSEYGSSLGYISAETSSVKDAIETAKKIYLSHPMRQSLILITGSFYTIGEARQLLGEKSVLGSLRETL